MGNWFKTGSKNLYPYAEVKSKKYSALESIASVISYWRIYPSYEWDIPLIDCRALYLGRPYN